MSKIINRICLMAASILVAALMCKGSAEAKVITVNGNTGQDIQAALDQAQNATEETTVMIPPGTYQLSSPLLVYSNTTIRATGATIVNRSEGAALTVSPYIDPTNIKVMEGIWSVNGNQSVIYFPGSRPGSNITLENVHVDGSLNGNSDTVAGIYLKNVIGGKVSGCDANGVLMGIDISWCEQIEISQNSILSVGETGFQAVNVKNLVVRDNWIVNSGKYGMLVDWDKSSVISGNTVKASALDPNRAGHGEGLVVRNSEGTRVENNNVTDVRSHIKDWGNGILIAASKDITVQGNTVSEAGNHGIQVTFASERVYLNNNTVTDSGNIGISISKASTADITGGVVNNTTGSAIVYDGKPYEGKTGVSGTVDGCQIDGSTAAGIHIEQAQVTVKNATVKNSTGMGVVVLNSTATLSNNVIRQDEVDAGANGIVTNNGARVTLQGNRICNFGNSGIVNNPGCVVNGTNNQIMVNANRFGANAIYNPQGGPSEIKNNTLKIIAIDGASVTGQAYWNDFECGAVVNSVKYETTVGAGGVSGQFSVSYPQTDSGRVVVYVRDDAGNAAILQAPPEFDLNKLQSGDRQLVENFVRRMYNTTLGRGASAEELKYYVDQLQSGAIDGATIAQNFVGSPEFQGKNLSPEDYVAAMYEAFFGRSAGAAEIQYWKNEMASGMSRKYVLRGFVNSNEFDILCQKAGITRGLMVLATGEEYEINYEKLGEFVERLYVCALKRNIRPSEAEKQYYVTGIANRTMTAETAAKNFFFSSEFESQQNSDEEYISRLYVTFMDREPAVSETGYWIAQMRAGLTRVTVLERFAESNEFKEIMKSYGIR